MSRGSPLEGRVAVVTGAARGIGAELARALSARGAVVAVLGLEPDGLAEVAAGCGPDAQWWAADVTDPEALRDVAAQVVERYGRVDVVVANAGIASAGPLLMTDERSYDRVMEVNLLGSVRTARAFLPAVVESRGYFLQIASLAALVPAPMMGSYCASKSGVEAFAHATGAEVAHLGVDVGVAYLSWVDTDMVRGADEIPGLAAMRRALPWPANRTYPVGPTVEALVRGIERRSMHVYGQGWVRGMQALRALLPTLGAPLAEQRAAKAEEVLRRTPGAATGLVGAGGAADEARPRTG